MRRVGHPGEKVVEGGASLHVLSEPGAPGSGPAAALSESSAHPAVQNLNLTRLPKRV